MTKKIFIIIFFTAGLCLAQIDENNQYMLAQSYVQAAMFDKAKPILEELYKNNPGNYEYFQSLNLVYTQLKDYDSSISLLEDQIRNSPQDINLYGMLGTTYYLKGNENKAFEIWDDALKTFPQNEMNYRVIANYAIERRTFDKAIQYLKKGQELSSNPMYFAYDLANLYALTMQFKEATEEYCIIIKLNPNQLSSIENRILGYTAKPGALQASIPVIEKYSNSENVSFKFLLARLYIEEKKYDDAYNLYEQIDAAQNGQGSQLLSFAQFLYGDKIYKNAEEVYKEILTKYPNSPYVSNAKLGYAKTLEAVLEEENSGKIPNWKPFYEVPKLNSSEVDKVISAYLEITKIYPHSEVANEAFLRIGEIKLNQQGEVSEAENFFNDIVKDSPLSQYTADAFLDLAMASIIQGNLDQAANYYLKVSTTGRYAEDKKNLASYRLARIYFFKGDFEKSKEYLKGILDNLGNNSANDALELSLLMNTSANDSSNLSTFADAELLAEQNHFQEAAVKYKIVSNNPNKLMLQNLAYLREAEMELAQNNIDSAIAHFQRIAEDQDKNIYSDKALYLLGMIYQYSLGNKAKAVETYENLLAKFPNSLYLDEARAEIIKLNGKTIDRPM